MSEAEQLKEALRLLDAWNVWWQVGGQMQPTGLAGDTLQLLRKIKQEAK